MSKFADKFIERALTILRAAEGEAIATSKALAEVHAKIIEQINSDYQDMTSVSLRLLEKKINNYVDQFYGQFMNDQFASFSAAIIQKELKWVHNTIMGETAKELTIPKFEVVADRVAKKTFQGHTFSFWAKKQGGHYSKLITNSLRDGFVNSRSISEVVRQVEMFSPRPRAEIRSLVRGYFSHAATESKDSVYSMNHSLIEGAVWVSTLDHRTTPLICGIRDGLEYDNERNPVGHSLPWESGPGRIHWGCRSVSVPKLRGIPYTGTRAATEPGADYKRGDAKTKTGKVRKNTKDAREKGIFRTEDKTTRTKYENWLHEQSKTNIDFVSDVLGSKEKAQLFRDGKETLSSLRMENPAANPTNINSL